MELEQAKKILNNYVETCKQIHCNILQRETAEAMEVVLKALEGKNE